MIERMFDSALDGSVGEDIAWTSEDDAMLAALTDAAARSETSQSSPAATTSSGAATDPVLVDMVLEAVLSRLDGSPGEHLVAELGARAKVVAFSQARLFESMMAIVDEYESFPDSDPALAMEAAVAEVRAALSLTRRAAESDLDLAWNLRHRLPDVGAALEQGRIDLRRAWVFVGATSHLDSDTARAVAARGLERVQGQTTGQLRALLRRLALEHDPQDVILRYQAAIQNRRVVAELNDDSTADITASGLAPDRVAAIMERLTRIAQHLRQPDEDRSIDQLRADAFLDLLEGNPPGDQRGVVDIRVDLATLIGLDQRAAELAGFGPVVGEIARQMSDRHGVSWRTTVTDRSGDVVHTGTLRRRPNAPVRRFVESRDPTCVFPGCRRPAQSCDLDHRIPVSEGGKTTPDQLVPLCRHDHVIRHRHGWTHTPNADGCHTWTSPLGNQYTRPPPEWADTG